jgi:hypothetical protein
MTKGEDRIRTNFNPSNNSLVGNLKTDFATLIDDVEAIPDDNNGEVIRLKSLAQTALEEAAMWAIKAATASE